MTAPQQTDTSFDRARREEAEDRAREMGALIQFDRLPATSFFGAPPKTSPYWTKRGAAMRAEMIARIGTDRVTEAAQILFAANNCFGPDLRGYAGIFEHNALTLAAALRCGEADLMVIDSHALRLDGSPTDRLGSGKIPRGSKWQLRASSDRDAIIEMWTGVGQYPPNKRGEIFDAAPVFAPRNLSLVVGGGVMVVDTDGAPGQRWLDENDVRLPETVEQVTGSGGRHLLYRVPVDADIRNSAGAVAQGVDIRGEAGQIMAGPSIHKSGNFYRWEDGCAPWEREIAGAPEWLIEVAQKASKKSDKSRRVSGRKVLSFAERQRSEDGPSGFAEWLGVIGDHDGGRGFNAPIFSAALSYFLAEGSDADGVELLDLLRARIEAADRDPARDRSKYDDDDYILEQIENARPIAEAIEAEDDDTGEDVERPETGEAPADAGGDLDSEDGVKLDHLDALKRMAGAGGNAGVGDDAIEVIEEEAVKREPAVAGSKDLPLAEQVAERFADGVDEESVIKFLRKCLRRGADAFERQGVTDSLFKVTGLGKRPIAKLWKRAEKEEAAHREANDPKAVRRLDIRTSDEVDMVKAAVSGLREANEADPSLFHYVDTLATIRPDAEGHARLNVFGSGAKLKHEINRLELFSKTVPDGDGTKNVRALVPDNVAMEVWTTDFTAYALPLRGLKTTPFFTSEGDLVVADGYDHGSMTVLATPADTAVPAHVLDPNWHPSPDEAKAAVRYLVAEVFADFPIDGDNRKELLRKLDAGEDTPSLCALIAMTLLPFMRQMIDGPTPGHFLAKPKPGTGASLLTDLVCLIAMGRCMPAMALPESKEETDKTIAAILTEGREVAYFDNINHSVDSGTLASAMTARNYGARILGKTQTVDTPVNCVWVLTGNNVTMTGELLRRCIAIILDANMGKPGEGRTFEKDNIARWVAEHRWELVTACLTIIKHWVAEGCPEGKAKTLASYEDWSRKMTGVLEAAGLRGFMTNLDDWKDEATDDTDDGQLRLLTLLAEYPLGTVFRPDGTDAPRNAATGKIEVGKVVSICDVLNDAGDPLKDGEAIVLAGWSYKELYDDVSDKVRVRYTNAAQVSKRFRALARSPSVVGAGEDQEIIAFEERINKKGGTRYWVRVKASD